MISDKNKGHMNVEPFRRLGRFIGSVREGALIDIKCERTTFTVHSHEILFIRSCRDEKFFFLRHNVLDRTGSVSRRILRMKISWTKLSAGLSRDIGEFSCPLMWRLNDRFAVTLNSVKGLNLKSEGRVRISDLGGNVDELATELDEMQKAFNRKSEIDEDNKRAKEISRWDLHTPVSISPKYRGEFEKFQKVLSFHQLMH